MPWKVFVSGSQYCIHKLTDAGEQGEKVSCHDSEDDANKQVRALYASEKPANENQAFLFSTGARMERQGDQEFLVVSGVPLREQVMKTYLVPAEEISKSVRGWNGTPITIYHPTQNNGSANVPDPDVAIIGRFYNAAWDANKRHMRGEYWINVAEAMKYLEGQAIIEGIKQNKTIETSTGYFADDMQVTGNFKGRDYISIHSNLLPDHIAILPRQVGACSVQDGCGVNRNEGGAVHNCGCGCPFENMQYPEFKAGHLPRVMLQGYSFNKGSRTAEQLEGLRAHIRDKGIDKPVIVMRQAGGEIKILDGNHRVALAEEFDIDQIPVTTIDEDLKPIDPEMMYREWLHAQDQSYLSSQGSQENQESHSQPAPAGLKRNDKKGVSMKFKDFLNSLAGKGYKVTGTTPEDMEVEEPSTPEEEEEKKKLPTQNTAGPGLSAADVSALQKLAGYLPVLEKLGSPAIQNSLDGLTQLPDLLEMGKTFKAQAESERALVIAGIKTNSANTYSDEELAALPMPVLIKMNAQMNTSFAGLGGAAQLFENADVLTLPSAFSALQAGQE